MQEPQDVSQTQPAPETGPLPVPPAAAAPPAAATPPPAGDDAGPPPAGDDAGPVPQLPPASAGPRRRTVGFAVLAGAIAVGALAIGLAVGSGAGDPSPAADQSKPAAQRPARISEAGWTSPDGRTRASIDGRGGRGPAGGRGYGAITITKIDGTQLSLETENGWTRTIDAAGATVTEGGETVTVSALEVGDQVVFRETRNDDGTYEITAIAVVQPSVAGTVTSVDGSSVTVTDRDGATKKVVLTDATTYALGRTDATKDAVVAGVRIHARGSLGSDGTLTASSVVVEPAVAMGTVKEKTSSTITLTTRDGSTVVVAVTSATTYAVAGIESATLADVAVGAVVAASGTENADGSLTATVVRARAAGEYGGPGMGGGPGRGHGRGGDGFPGWGPGSDSAPESSPPPSGEGTSS